MFLHLLLTREVKKLSNACIKINVNTILRLKPLKGSSIYLGCFVSNYRLKTTWAYARSLKDPFPLVRFPTFFWVPLPPFRAYVLLKWPSSNVIRIITFVEERWCKMWSVGTQHLIVQGVAYLPCPVNAILTSIAMNDYDIKRVTNTESLGIIVD